MFYYSYVRHETRLMNGNGNGNGLLIGIIFLASKWYELM